MELAELSNTQDTCHFSNHVVTVLRQLYNYEGVSNAVNCIADFGCKRLFKLIKLPQTLCCFHPGWDGYDHIRQWWWKRLASPSGWSWAKHYHTIAIIFKHLLIVP